jgi:arginyl-tRNA synthetase
MTERNPVREELLDWLAQVLPLERAQVESLLAVPPDPKMGDYALPCFVLGGPMYRTPSAVAADLAARFRAGRAVLACEATGPYANFRVDRRAMTEHVLRQVLRAGDDYGRGDAGEGRTVVIDYSSPNIAKHLAVHHLRSAIIGRSLCLIFRAQGWRVVGVNHLGDWGTSFGKLIAAFERYPDLDPRAATVTDLQAAYVRFSREAKGNPALEDAARAAFQRLEQGDPAAAALWRRFKEISLAEFERVYEMLGVRFDHVTPESFYLPMVPDCLARLERAGLTRLSEGALIVPLDAFDLPPVMLRKSDGATLYITRDICAAQYRRNTFGSELILYVVGSEQKLHFAQLRKLLELAGHDWADAIEHVDFGLIKFRDPETGQPVKGSTREGAVVLLEDVLREGVQKARRKILDNVERLEEGTDLDELAAQVGIGAVMFSDLCVKRAKDVVFDWDRMLDFEGDTGPYVQYAHARLCSIQRKAGCAVDPAADCSLLTLPEEWALVRLIEDFPSRVREAAQTREPFAAANYLLELCACFSTYYSAGMREPERRVLCEDGALRRSRMLLVEAVRHVIRNGLALLGIAAPERM